MGEIATTRYSRPRTLDGSTARVASNKYRPRSPCLSYARNTLKLNSYASKPACNASGPSATTETKDETGVKFICILFICI